MMAGTMVMVAIPLTPTQLDELLAGEAFHHPIQAFSPNRALWGSFDIVDDEEAEYAALLVAGLWSVVMGQDRLVGIAQVDPAGLTPGAEAANGGVLVTGLCGEQLVAYFTDEDDSVVQHIGRSVRGMDLDRAWADEAFQALVLDHPMLWHDISEWRV